ncbi:MAG: ABC transporter permease [Myxococcota bacterium]|nr:ABC transporter permease [Myxococcota bacterium]
MIALVLKTLALVGGIALVVGLLVAVVVLAIALVRMVGVGIMQWRDAVSLDRWQEVLSTISRNKLRTFLTTVSVAWGIFVLVTLLGMGRGLEGGMRKTFARNATNTIWISANKTSMPHAGYDVGRKLMFENADYERARKVEGVEYISGQHWIGGRRWGGAAVRFGAKSNSFELEAVHPQAIRMQLHDITEGRFISEADIIERRKAAVIGQTVSSFLFEGAPAIGQWITVGSVAFQVVGVFTDPGGPEEERRIYLPVSTAQLAYNGGDKLGQLQLTVGDAGVEESQEIVDRVVGQLADRYDFAPEDRQAVRVFNMVEGAAKFRAMFFMISVFVAVIGLGTLAAGVVGVSNIMMIAVKERTKEIGVRKALGATPRSIVFMIIQEAVFLTGIAGLLGLSGGVAALELMTWMDIKAIHNPSIDISTGIGATVFLVIAGALAGYFPARAAAKVNPISALRDQ